MGLIGLVGGLVKRLIKLGLLLGILGALIIFIPNLPPYTKFSTIKLDPDLPRTGPLAPNGDLNELVKVYENKVLGPEAFQLFEGDLYTGLATGEIVKLSQGHVTFVTKIGRPCASIVEAQKCGRPLGFEIDEKTRQLYVADAYYGIWKVDLKTDKKTLLVSPRVAIEGRQPKIFNGLALAKNNDIYWTDSSSDFQLFDGSYGGMADPSGRLFHYNVAKNESKVLLDNLWLANGVAVSPDNQFVLVAESFRYKIMKYYIAGPKKGKSEVFVSGLPGAPDNLRALPDGSGVVAALYTSFSREDPLLMRTLAEAPLARKLLARLLRLVEIPFEFLNEQFPNPIFENIVFHIGHFSSVASLLPDSAGIVRLDWDGKIVSSHYHTEGKLEGISDAIVYNDRLYTGSPHANYVASFPVPSSLKKAFVIAKTSPPPKTTETVKPVEKKVEERLSKPATQEPPKQKPKPPTQDKKPAEPKPTPTPKPTPAEPKTTTPKPSAPKTSPPKKEEKVATPPQKPTTPIGKEPKATTPKPAQAQPTQAPPQPKKTADAKPAPAKPVPEQIPIKEEIPSDTAKPVKENLKVIKKGGPTEIPNPSL